MDRRTLLSTTMFTVAGYILARSGGPASGEETGQKANLQTIPDEKNYYKGPFGAYCSPFYRFYDKAIRRGVDYQDEMVIDESRFPDNTLIRWRWPDDPPKTSTGVYGYMHVYLGDYSGGKPPQPTKPIQIRSIATFHEVIDFTITSGDGDGFDVLNEFFLTSEAGNHEKRLFEIGFILHTNTRTIGFVGQNRAIGTWQDGEGRAWSAVITSGAVPYVVFTSVDQNDIKGALDVKDALAFLVEQDVLTGEEWINGVAVGVEPHFGRGELRLDQWTIVLN